MNLSAFILHKIMGWTATDTLPLRDKCILCIAPHTSNWDFIIGQLYYRAIGRRAGFLMKKEWFVGPLGWFFRRMGGIPVARQKNSSMTDSIATQALGAERFALAITPEGTRKRVATWKHGFYYIALKANMPIQCYAIDFAKKHITGTLELMPSGDIEADLHVIMDYYRNVKGRHPENFAIEEA